MRGFSVALALAVAVAACGGAAQRSSQFVRADSVRMFDDTAKPETQWGYAPSNIQVAKGTTVTFTNGGTQFHTVTSDGATRTFDLGVDPGKSGTLVFDKAGTFTYHCGVHPDMKGSVQVCDGACP